MRIPVSVRTNYIMADIKVLVDSGATDNFISPAFAKKMRLGTIPLARPRKIWNIDNTENKAGCITHFTTLDVQTKGKHTEMTFLITDVGNENMVLGYPWLATYEPKVSWRDATLGNDVLPVIVQSLSPKPPPLETNDTYARRLNPEETRRIVEELTSDSMANSTSTQLTIAAQQYTVKTALPPEYAKYARLFDEEVSHRFPPSCPWDHAIDFVKNAPPFLDCKIYPMTREEDVALKDFLEEQLRKGYICPSMSPYASLFFFIHKKNGKLRPVQDYRKINAMTVRNMAPVPRAADHIHDLGGAQYYTKMDVRSGYNNVRIKDGDQGKGAFKTRYGLFEPTVMFFGLTNSPATFQTMMDNIFRDVILKHEPLGTTIRVYIDDIGIATRTSLQDHVAAVHDVLSVALTHDLFFSLKKCLFHAPEMDHLGVILGKGVTRMDPVKIAGIKDWPTLTKVKDVHSFLGFCNFYRIFIRGFANHARPLNKLTRKDTPWQWGKEEDEAFRKLKDLVTSEPVLAHPDQEAPFELEVDASGYAIGAVLSQRKSDNKLHPVAYFSATLNKAERNYDIYGLELYAIVRALRHWRWLLAGAKHKIKIYSDHKNLQYWKSPQHINCRIAREVLELSEYDYEIHHVKCHGRPRD